MVTGPARHNRPSDSSSFNAPDVVVERLPLYVRVLAGFESSHDELVSSEQLALRLDMTPAQIRKDLSYFGRFGKQGRGYNVEALSRKLRQILGLDRSWNACLVGVGRLGCAIISYPGFAPEGFNIVSAFDASNLVVGTVVDRIQVQALPEIGPTVREKEISIGIVAVPALFAQEVIDLLVEAGIGAILNYAPITAHTPDKVRIKNIDPVMSLQSMTYYLKD